MPGLLGVIGGPENKDIGRRFAAVRAAMERGGRLTSEMRTGDGRWGLGRVHLNVLQPAPQLAGDGPIRVLFHGDLDNDRQLRATLEQRGKAVADGPASLIAALYECRGREFAADLKGAFCACVLDETNAQLVLVTDRLGSYPIYWFKDAEGLVFASELRAALRAHPRPTLNLHAVSDLLKFAFPLGDKTLAAGVDLVPAASTLTYRSADGVAVIHRYSSIAASFKPRNLEHREYVEGVAVAFRGAMDRATAGSHRYGLSLSGGLDTRVILSALDRLHCRVTTFTLGGRGCADEVIAYQLARMAGSVHRFIALDDRYLGDLLPTLQRMVSLTDGMYVSHGFTEMLALSAFEESDVTVLLRGHGGELAKASTAWPLQTDAHIFAMKSREEFVPYLLSRLTHVSRGDSARDVLAAPRLEALDGYGHGRALEAALDGADLAPADLCSYLYVHEYHRRVTIPSLEIFRNATEVRMPLADVDFIERVVQGPARWRDGTAVHQALIANNNAAYLRVRNPNTGAPAGAGPVREAIFDKLNTVLRRLNVYGYRHYHSFDGWMRGAFLGIVDRVLLDADTLNRGVFREATVRELVRTARQGSHDHDDLLQALVTVELWQRENL